jgi:MFS family permease
VPAGVPAPYPPRLQAWTVVGILVLASLVSFMDRQIIALLVEPMRRDLRISDAQVGWLFSGFAIFYAVAGIPLAYLADRGNRKWLICAGIMAWSAMTVACGLARDFWMLMLARIGVGVGEASLTPAAHSMIADYFPREKIPVAVAVFQISGTLGTGVAFVAGGLVVALVGNAPPIDAGPFGMLQPWQMVFLYVGAPGMLVVLAMLAVREPVRRGVIRSYAGRPVGLGALAAFYRRNWRTFACHHLGYGVLSLVGFATVFWTPTFFQRIHDVPAGVSGIGYGLYFFVFASTGTFFGAKLGEHLFRKGYDDAPLRATLMGVGLMVPFGLLTPVVPWEWLAWVLYAPLMFFMNTAFGLAVGSLPVIAPSQMRGQVAAVYTLFNSAFGMGMGPVLVGAINDNLFPEADGVRHSLLLLMACGAPVWFTLLWLGRKHYASSYREAAELERTGALPDEAPKRR